MSVFSKVTNVITLGIVAQPIANVATASLDAFRSNKDAVGISYNEGYKAVFKDAMKILGKGGGSND